MRNLSCAVNGRRRGRSKSSGGEGHPQGQELIVLSESIIQVIILLSFITFAVTSKLNGIGVEIHIIIKYFEFKCSCNVIGTIKLLQIWLRGLGGKLKGAG
jgi:hypothetical protein